MEALLIVLFIVILRSCHGELPYPCSPDCVCVPLDRPGMRGLLGVRCESPHIPRYLPEQTASLQFSGLIDTKHSKFNTSLSQLRNLTFRDCTLDDVLSEASFVGFEFVERLTLQNLPFVTISTSFLRKLHNLTSVTFDRVSSSVSSLADAVKNANRRTLREVHFQCEGPNMLEAVILDEQFYRKFESLKITHLSIVSCSIAIVRKGFPKFFPNIVHFNLSHNLISGDKLAVVDISKMKHIRVWDVSYQYVPYYDSGILKGQFDLPVEEDSLFCFSLPPKLERFDFRHVVGNLNWIQFCVDDNNSLQHLDLSENFLFKVKKPLRGFHSLTYLNVRYVHMTDFPLNCFHDVPKLEIVNLSYNQIKKVIESDVNGTIFQNNRKLKALDLAFCSINSITDAFMVSIRNVETLRLEGNHLHRLNITVLRKITLLNISSNRFESLDDNFILTLKERATLSNITVDLTNNPMSIGRPCCEIANSIILFEMENLHFHGANTFQCIHNDKLEVVQNLSMEKLDEMCRPFVLNPDIYMIIILASVVLISVTTSVIIYRKKWCLKSFILAGRRYVKSRRKRIAGQFKFAAFVAYGESDSAWVRETLLPHMENVHRLHMCLHERNFTPGEPIEENISSAIDSSRRVILVISEAFMTSHWCVFEMRLARQMEVERGHDIIVPVILQHVDCSKGNRTLFNILNQNTYLEWPRDDEEGQKFFMQRLADTLKSYPDSSLF